MRINRAKLTRVVIVLGMMVDGVDRVNTRFAQTSVNVKKKN